MRPRKPQRGSSKLRRSRRSHVEQLEIRALMSVVPLSRTNSPGNTPDVKVCGCDCPRQGSSVPSGSEIPGGGGGGSLGNESSPTFANSSSSSAPPTVYTTPDGNLVVDVSIAGIDFAYNSGTAAPRPMIMFDAPVNWYGGVDMETQIKGYLGNRNAAPKESAVQEFALPQAVEDAPGVRTFVLQTEGIGDLPSGRYLWAINMEDYNPDPTSYRVEEDGSYTILSGPVPGYHTFLTVQDIVNRADSQFGPGWWLPELDRLYITAPPADPTAHTQPLDVTNVDWSIGRTVNGVAQEQFDSTDFAGQLGQYDAGALLVTGDNHAKWFHQRRHIDPPSGLTVYDTQFDGEANDPTSLGTLSTLPNGNYQLLAHDGTKEIFSTDGYLIYRVDRRGQIARKYDYTPGGNLDNITDYPSTYSETGTQTPILTGSHSRVYHFGTGLWVTDHWGQVSAQRTFYFGGQFSGGPINSVRGGAGGLYTISYNPLDQVHEIVYPGGMDIVYDSMASKVHDATQNESLFRHTLNDPNNDLFETQTEIDQEGSHTFTVRRDNGDLPDQKYHYDWLATAATEPPTDPALDDTTTFYYKADGLLWYSIAPDPTGENGSYLQQTFYSHDLDGRLIGITPPSPLPYEGWNVGSHVTTTSGDVAIVPSSYTDGTHTIAYGYHADNTSGDPDYSTDSDFSPTYYEYTDGTGGTPAGLIQDIIDAQGHDTHYAYAGLDITDITTLYGTPDALTTHFDYTDDGRENVKEISDADRHTKFFYNYSDLVIERDDPHPTTGQASAAQAWHYAYDANGNLTAVTDPMGNTTGYVYNSADDLEQLVEPNPAGAGPGLVTRYDYDEHGMLETMTDPLNNITTYQYDVLHRLDYLREPDPGTGSASGGPQTNYAYNIAGWLTTLTDPGNNITAYLYDSAGRSTYTLGLTDDGVQEQYYANASDSQPTQTRVDADISASDLPGSTGNYRVHWEGAVYIAATGLTTFNLTHTDSAYLTIDGNPVIGDAHLWQGWHLVDLDYYHSGNDAASISISYQTPGSPSALPLPLRQAVVNRTEYDGQNRVAAVTDPMGRKTSYFLYNAFDEPKYIDTPDPSGGASGVRAQIDYDRLGNQLAVTDPMGHRTQYVYDEQSRLYQTILPIPDGHSPKSYAQSVPDGNGWTGGSTSSPGGSTTLTFSGLDNAKRYEVLVYWSPDSTDHDKYDKDARFQISGGGSAEPLRTTYINLNAEPGTSSKNLGAFQPTATSLSLTISDHDAMGEDPHSGLLTVGMVELVEVGPVTTQTYDAVGHLNTLTDPDGNTTQWAYDELDRVKTETNAPGYHRDYKYDADGNLIQKTDRLGRVTQYNYDRLSRQTAERWLAGDENSATIRTIGYAYNDDSWLTGVTDRNAGGNAMSTDYGYQYDHLGRATIIGATVIGVSTGVALDQKFDADSNRIGLAASVGGVNDFANDYQFDALDRVTTVVQHGNADANTDGYVVAPKRVDFSYFADSQFKTIARYDSLTASTSSLALKSTYRYDDTGRLTGLTYTNTAGNVTYAGYGLEYNAADRITRFTNSVNSADERRYAYDAAGQLTDVGYAGQTAAHDDEVYRYDANGNRTSANGHAYTLNPSGHGDNQIASDGTYNYQYDAEGNLTRKTSATNSADYTVYAYDYRNRLVSVTHHGLYDPPDDPDRLFFVNTATYQYDTFDRLIYRTDSVNSENSDDNGGSEEAIVYDGSEPVLRFMGDLGDTLDGTHLYERYLWGPAVDMLLAEDGGGTLWALTDQENTIREHLYRWNGNVYTYSDGDLAAFGEGSDELPGFVYQISTLAFTGRFTDPDTGLQWNGERWTAQDGRWMTQDPIFPLSGTNPYSYCGDDPVNNVDSSGLGFFRWLYTGDWNAPDNVYSAATEAAGKSYTANAGRAHQKLRHAGPLGAWASIVLGAAEGGNLHEQLMAPIQMQAQQQNPGGPGMNPWQAVPGMPNMNAPQKDIEKQVIIAVGNGAVAVAVGAACRTMSPEEAKENGLTERDPGWPWRGQPGYDDHHLFPSELRGEFWKRGLDPEAFKFPVPAADHRLLPNGIHTGPYEESWNGVWKQFFEENPGAGIPETIDQLIRMRQQFGI
jgi:RHS repeat-associated protein